MSQVVLLCEDPDPERFEKFNNTVQNIAKLFWKLDDLIDIPQDILSDDVNSIVIICQQKNAGVHSSLNDFIEFLLGGDDIDQTVNNIFEYAFELFKLFDESSNYYQKISLREIIMTYIFAWIDIYPIKPFE